MRSRTRPENRSGISNSDSTSIVVITRERKGVGKQVHSLVYRTVAMPT